MSIGSEGELAEAIRDAVIRPHQLVEFTHLDDRLAGSYQVTKALHVITASDHFMDIEAHANGLGGAG